MIRSIAMVLTLLCTLLLAALSTPPHAAMLSKVTVVDQDYLMVHCIDGDVVFKDDGEGPNAFMTASHFTGQDTVKPYGSPLNTIRALPDPACKHESVNHPSGP